jgi:NADP-dependent 3-hydroxy acid dehydrogenase YdfG
MTFADKAAIVTGASSGIGRAVAVELARRGAKVGVLARRADLLQELVAEIRHAGGIAELAVGDVTDSAATTAAVRHLSAVLGPVDLIFANAGFGRSLPADDPGHAANVADTVRINLLGVVNSFAAVLPDMLARGSGHLAAVSSLAAYKGLPGAAAYCASKSAVNAYCEALRIELHTRNVRVTTICPGFVTTAMTATNSGPMPFLTTPDRAARRIVSALERGAKVYDFPKRLRLLMWLSKWAPDRFMARRVPIRAT